jgi:hypothetical protein
MKNLFPAGKQKGRKLLTKYQTLPYDKNKSKHGGIMKKLLIALAIMAFLLLSSCKNTDNDNGSTNQKIGNPGKIELSGKNNLVFK